MSGTRVLARGDQSSGKDITIPVMTAADQSESDVLEWHALVPRYVVTKDQIQVSYGIIQVHRVLIIKLYLIVRSS